MFFTYGVLTEETLLVKVKLIPERNVGHCKGVEEEKTTNQLLYICSEKKSCSESTTQHNLWESIILWEVIQEERINFEIDILASSSTAAKLVRFLAVF